MAGFGAHWARQMSLARLGHHTSKMRKKKSHVANGTLPDALEEYHSTCDGPQGHSSWFGRQSGDRRSDLGNHGKNVLFAVKFPL